MSLTSPYSLKQANKQKKGHYCSSGIVPAQPIHRHFKEVTVTLLALH